MRMAKKRPNILLSFIRAGTKPKDKDEGVSACEIFSWTSQLWNRMKNDLAIVYIRNMLFRWYVFNAVKYFSNTVRESKIKWAKMKWNTIEFTTNEMDSMKENKMK